MRLTVGQIAELHTTSNIVGFTKGEQLYRVTMREPAAIRRLRELSNLAQVPDWYVIDDRAVTIEIATSQPEWFIELEQETINARR